MIVAIIAASFNPQTGRPKGSPREETVDTSKNELFKNCVTLTDVVDCYMHYWNKFPTVQKELVLVSSIRLVRR